MRYLNFASISFSLVLFFCNHAHARIGESYADSVKRYTAAGFKKERTTLTAPENDKGLEYCSLPYEDWDFQPNGQFGFMHFEGVYSPRDIRRTIRAGCTELTWTKDAFKPGGEVQVVKIYQVFFGVWPHSKSQKPWQEVLCCQEIYYTFKDKVDKSSQTYKSWRNSLFTAQSRNKKWQGEPLDLEEDIAGSSRTLHLRFDHQDPGDYLMFVGRYIHPGYAWETMARKKRKIDLAKKDAEAARKPQPRRPPTPITTQQEFDNSGL
ncbi:MAG: hypothetical protein ACR2NF_07090 [Pirellulales bacterium]